MWGTTDGKIDEAKQYSYVYDNEDIILEYLTKTEDDESKTEATKYVHGSGIDEPLSIERKGDIYYYHADGLGSITALTDKKQKVVESYTYSAFGEVKRKSDKVKNTFTFTAREWDEEIGLYYYRARYYDPMNGRFISRDPIGFEGGDVNLYSYVKNNPQTHADPDGRKVQMCYSPLDSWLGTVIGKHTSVRASCGTYGFHPKSKTTANYLWGPGKVESDSGRVGLNCIDTLMTECVDESCVCNKINADRNSSNPHNYGVVTYNCFSWASQVISQCKK